MTVKMILAVDRGNAIGWKDGRLPWKIPADMKRFKELTSGHDVLMGYNTFKSLGRPAGLPNRRNYVMTHRHRADVAECENVFLTQCNTHGITNPAHWVKAHQEILGGNPPDLWIIGGATIYTQAIQLKIVDEIHLTLVDDNSGADVKMKAFDLSAWKLFVVQQRENGVQWNLEYMSAPQKTDGGLSYTFLTLKKTQ